MTSISSILSSVYSSKSAAFSKADADGDGKLSVAEFQSIGSTESDSAASTKKSSANDLKAVIESFLSGLQQGGMVSGANMLAAQGSTPQPSPPQKPEDFLKVADTDGDGAISLDEFKAAAPKDADLSQAEDMFNKIDSDGDGTLSLSELTTDAETKQAAGAGGAHHMHGGGKKKDDDDDDTATAIDPLDTNGDGVVSMDELLGGVNQLKAQMSQFFLQQQEQASAA